jgi:hypothetical protein
MDYRLLKLTDAVRRLGRWGICENEVGFGAWSYLDAATLEE